MLDSLAIAAQTLTGAALGTGQVARATAVAKQTTKYSTVFALILALAFAVGARPIQAIFTQDQVVLADLAVPWWLLIAMILVGGVVFALDGVLLGASDAKFLRNLTIISVLGAFVPMTVLSAQLGWGLTGIWVGHLASVVVRLLGVIVRFRSMRWVDPAP